MRLLLKLTRAVRIVKSGQGSRDAAVQIVATLRFWGERQTEPFHS